MRFERAPIEGLALRVARARQINKARPVKRKSALTVWHEGKRVGFRLYLSRNRRARRLRVRACVRAAVRCVSKNHKSGCHDSVSRFFRGLRLKRTGWLFAPARTVTDVQRSPHTPAFRRPSYPTFPRNLLFGEVTDRNIVLASGTHRVCEG